MQAAPLVLPLSATAAAPALEPGALEVFPAQTAALAGEMVTVAHSNFKRVKELAEAHPSLVKASWDWGFGDWETALGAASHTGRREIAEYLIEKGAPPTLFSATMLGHLEVVQSLVKAQPGVQRIPGPHSISLLNHAKAGGAPAAKVYDYLQSLGDAGSPPDTPLSEADAAALAGTYVFGEGPNDQIQIKAQRGFLQFIRTGKTPRGLIHLGDHVFHPIGASAVRIRFAAEGPAMVLTVSDPDVMLTARRT
jgi:hypothetical protein